MATASTMSMLLHGSNLGPWGDLDAPGPSQSNSLAAFLAFVTGSCSPGRGLDMLPGELILEVFKNLDLANAVALAASCKRLQQLFMNHRAHIVFSILPSDPEARPADGLFQVAAMKLGDLDIPWGTLLGKEVWFGRMMLCTARQLPVRIRKDRISSDLEPGTDGEETALRPDVVCFGDSDVDRLLEISKVVRGWERIFPRFRFSQHPEHARKLRAHEATRLRRALYHWMRYDYYFHGDNLPALPGPLEPFGSDERCNFVRMLDSGEAAELADLWITVKAAVASLCPSLTAVRLGVESQVTEEELGGVAWGTEEEHCESVSTMLRLGPERLLYYIEHTHEYSKARLIEEIRRERPCIETDAESLTAAISVVYRERYDHCLSQEAPAPPSPFSFPREPFGGILDWGEDKLESLRGSVEAGFGLWLPDEDAEGEEGEVYDMPEEGLGL